MSHAEAKTVCLLVVVLGSFSSPVVTAVSGFIGDSVILSCSIPESKLEGAAVHWRDDQGKNVFDIFVITTAEYQAEKYKNRVETFPDEQKKGNVSIRLIGLQKTDEGMFTCTVTGEQYQNETRTKVHVKGVYNLKIFIGKTEILN